MSGAPDAAKSRIAREPVFANDQKNLPLQAADLLAWWSRRRYLEKRQGLPRLEFPGTRRSRVAVRHLIWTEEKLIQFRAVSMAYLAGGIYASDAVKFDENCIPSEITIGPGHSLKFQTLGRGVPT
jgi:hypothetical protein